MRKRVVVVLLVLVAFLGGLLVARGYPDWSLNVIQREGTTFVVTGQVDANITNTQIDVNVTNSTITIEPAEGSEFVIKPAQDVVFTIQGDVNATIQGTASVSIDNATVTIDVATIRERASEENKILYHTDSVEVNPNDVVTNIAYTNTNNYTIYLEAITFCVVKSDTTDPDINPMNVEIWFEIQDDQGNEVARFYVNPPGKVMNFDPAIPILPNWKILANINNMQDTHMMFDFSYIFRK